MGLLHPSTSILQTQRCVLNVSRQRGHIYILSGNVPLFQDFWKAVVFEIYAITDICIVLDPKVLLLGINDSVAQFTHKKVIPVPCVFLC